MADEIAGPPTVERARRALDAAIPPGIKFRLVNPAWEHECCYPGSCNYRTQDAAMYKYKCESPTECDYFVPPPKITGPWLT